jgi:hypothetical protein
MLIKYDLIHYVMPERVLARALLTMMGGAKGRSQDLGALKFMPKLH